MRLELQNVKIDDIVFGNETRVEGSQLILDKESIVNQLKELEGIKDIDIDIALPGEKKRIIPVKDVIEPRVKVSGGEGGFPGALDKIEQAGSGEVKVLDGVAIVTIGDIVGFQEGIIDMWGEGAKWTPFSQTCNIVVDITPEDDLQPHEHEAAVRRLGLTASNLIGEAARDAEYQETEVYEMGYPDEESEKYPDLPKVVYVEMLISQGLLHDGYIYGTNSGQILPTYLHANEELDQAVISGNCVAACDKITTYQHQNNAVVKELYKLHGKEINFVGIVLAPELTTMDGKLINTDYTAKLCKQLGADGAIISEEGYGNPDSDLVMICEALETDGIKTVLITDECSGWDGTSQPLTDAKEEAVAVISTGNVSHLVELDAADEVLGDPHALANIAGGWEGAYDEETGKMQCELNAVIGSTSEIGTHNATVKLY